MTEQDPQAIVEPVQETEAQKKAKEYQTVSQSIARIVNYFISVAIGIAAFLGVMYLINGEIDSGYWSVLAFIVPIALVIKAVIEYVNYNRFHDPNKG